MIKKIQQAEELYTIISLCTKLPYVECDPETFDDKVFLYFNEEDASYALQKLEAMRRPAQIAKLEENTSFPFLVSLHAMGVNCVVVKPEGEGAESIQLNEIIDIPAREDVILNPALHLTTIYLMQELRSNPEAQGSQAVEELNEEMNSHLHRGRYLIPMREEQEGVPLLRQSNGELFQPFFTDIGEYQKFCLVHKDEAFQCAVVEAENLHKIMVKEARGMVLNPMGVNVQMNILKKE